MQEFFASYNIQIFVDHHMHGGRDKNGGGGLLGIAKKNWIGQQNPNFLMCLQTRAMMMKVSKGMEVKLAGDGHDYEVVKYFGHQ